MTGPPVVRNELGQFLRARRTQLSPESVGVVPGVGLRRTPGLRREEVALLSGVSADYYTRLEQGKETRPSPAVIEGLVRALQLTEAEQEHLRTIAAAAAGHAMEVPDEPSRAVSPGVLQLLEQLRPLPAYVLSRVGDFLASNPSGSNLFPGSAKWPIERRNVARYLFLDPAARSLLPDWEDEARTCIAGLRALAGVGAHVHGLADLVGELIQTSPDFADLWERYEVKSHVPEVKTFHHPMVGVLTLGFQAMSLEGTPGYRLSVYYMSPGTSGYEALVRLDADSVQ